MRNADLAIKDSTRTPGSGTIDGGPASEVMKMKDDSPLSGPGELDLAKLVDEVLGEMPVTGDAESGKVPLYQPKTLPLEMSPHAARLALEEAERAMERRRKEAEELGHMKTAAAPIEVAELQRAVGAAVPGLAVQPAVVKPVPAAGVPATAAPASPPADPPATAPAAKVEAKPEAKADAKVEAKADAKVAKPADPRTTTKTSAKKSGGSAGRWIMIAMGLVVVGTASTAGWLAYKKSPLLGHASAATTPAATTAPETKPAAPAEEGTMGFGAARTNESAAAAEAKPPPTAEAKAEEPKPATKPAEAKAAAPKAKPAEAKTEEPKAASEAKPKRTASAGPKPEAKAPEEAPAPKPAPAPAQPASVDAILQQQLKGAIP